MTHSGCHFHYIGIQHRMTKRCVPDVFMIVSSARVKYPKMRPCCCLDMKHQSPSDMFPHLRRMETTLHQCESQKLTTLMGIYHLSFCLDTAHTSVWTSPKLWQLLTYHHGIRAHKTGIFITTAMRTSNNTNEITIIYNTDSI